MIKVFNASNKELPVATDEECVARRNVLVHIGIIKPNKDFDADNWKRQRLVGRGVIQPNLISTRPMNFPSSKGEGKYKVRPIKTEAGYERRKQAYFIALQEILRGRRELNLIFNEWDTKKWGVWQDWYF